jgi:signal transduction histidine kinase
MLRDSVLLAAALSGAVAVLVLKDETGTWYRDSSGLTSEQLADIEPALMEAADGKPGGRGLPDQGLQIVETLPIVDTYRRVIGTLGLLSPAALAFSAVQKDGLDLLVSHIQTIVVHERQKLESRASPRAPLATSFVPGLVHELGSFIFGISANLDAFEARFADREDVTRYGANIRRSLDRMSAFLVELREYGDPNWHSWAPLDLEPLLREVLAYLRPTALDKGIELQLEVAGTLPPANADRQSLRSAFINLLDLVLRHEEAGCGLVLHVSTNGSPEAEMICGHVDSSSPKFRGVDPARFFEPFYFRVSGLGRLALPGARRVFESHGGALVAGPGPEGGLRIRFRLPAVWASPPRSVRPS